MHHTTKISFDGTRVTSRSRVPARGNRAFRKKERAATWMRPDENSHVQKKIRAVTVAVRDDENKSRLFIIDERKSKRERAGEGESARDILV